MSAAWTPLLALVLAFAIDRTWGEPRNAWHPVAWLGRWIGWLGQRLPWLSPAWGLSCGALAWTLTVGAVVGLAWVLEQALAPAPVWAAIPLLALALKPSFAWRVLADEVRAVETALQHSLPAGRARVAQLCSRDTSTLSATEVREAAVETLAENTNDAFVATLFWFVVAGLPGAWGWRAINTLDACWGYRGRWEWAGKVAARADDCAAWLPARLTAALLRPVSWAALQAEAHRTPSPNGGWPMAALALRLNVRLGKPGVYLLHAAGREVQAADVAQALQLIQRVAWAALALALAALAAQAAWAAWP